MLGTSCCCWSVFLSLGMFSCRALQPRQLPALSHRECSWLGEQKNQRAAFQPARCWLSKTANMINERSAALGAALEDAEQSRQRQSWHRGMQGQELSGTRLSAALDVPQPRSQLAGCSMEPVCAPLHSRTDNWLQHPIQSRGMWQQTLESCVLLPWVPAVC